MCMRPWTRLRHYVRATEQLYPEVSLKRDSILHSRMRACAIQTLVYMSRILKLHGPGTKSYQYENGWDGKDKPGSIF